MMDEDTDAQALPEGLVATLADPAGNAARVPSLLRCLDGEDPDVRLAAGTALCLVAGTDGELRTVVVERLLDRFGTDAPPEVGHTLEYLAVRYPETVEECVIELDDDAEHRAAEQLVAEAGEYRRTESLARRGPDRSVGRTRVAGADRDPDPRPVYVRDDEETEDGAAASEDDEEGESDDEGTETGDDDAATPDEGAATDERDVTTATLRLVSRRLSAVVAASEFDDLTVLNEGRRDRYGDVYRTVGRLDGENYAVALTVYGVPESESVVDGFRSVMTDWREVRGHDAVLPVYDWGVRPRPWAAVEYAGGSLATHGHPDDPLRTALELAGAVGHLHRYGVVHGAVDPGNVAYREVELDGSDRQPLLTNPGVATLAGFDPSGDDGETSPRPRGVDPRYAAPEHYDEDYGRIDAATDVYGLGTLVFRLVTGDHPYVGDPETVRTLVCSTDDSPADRLDPTLSEPIDRVVRKATATRKIKRYETVTAFERELQQASEVTRSDGTDA